MEGKTTPAATKLCQWGTFLFGSRMGDAKKNLCRALQARINNDVIVQFAHEQISSDQTVTYPTRVERDWITDDVIIRTPTRNITTVYGVKYKLRATNKSKENTYFLSALVTARLPDDINVQRIPLLLPPGGTVKLSGVIPLDQNKSQGGEGLTARAGYEALALLPLPPQIVQLHDSLQKGAVPTDSEFGTAFQFYGRGNGGGALLYNLWRMAETANTRARGNAIELEISAAAEFDPDFPTAYSVLARNSSPEKMNVVLAFAGGEKRTLLLDASSSATVSGLTAPKGERPAAHIESIAVAGGVPVPHPSDYLGSLAKLADVAPVIYEGKPHPKN